MNCKTLKMTIMDKQAIIKEVEELEKYFKSKKTCQNRVTEIVTWLLLNLLFQMY